MLRRLAAIAACAVFLGAVPTGSLYVTTLPGQADVWIDGTYVGRTPLVVDALAGGHHSIGIAKAGWSPQQIDVSVVAGQTSFSSLKLLPAKGAVPASGGTIALHGAQIDAIRVDGVPVRPGKDDTIPVAAGTHEVAVRTGRGKVTRMVTVWPATRTDVLVQPDEQRAPATVVAPADDYLPAEAVRIDGERVVIRYGSHRAVGRIGSTTYRVDGRARDYDAAPTRVGGRLYLPIGLLTDLGGTADH